MGGVNVRKLHCKFFKQKGENVCIEKYRSSMQNNFNSPFCKL